MVTQREFLKNEVLSKLKLQLDIYGFKLNKSLPGFIKKTEYGKQKFHLIFLTRVVGWEINTGLLVRFDVVEDIYHKVSGFKQKYQKGTDTICSPIENLYLNELKAARFDLFEESQIDDVVNELLSLFKSVAIPFFDKYHDLNSIDECLNNNPESTFLTGPIFKGMESLIIAKLLNRKDFCDLEQIYQTYYENFSNGFYLPEYLKLKEYLKKM